MCENSGRCLAAFKTPFPPQKMQKDGWCSFLKHSNCSKKCMKMLGFRFVWWKLLSFSRDGGWGFLRFKDSSICRAAPWAFCEKIFLWYSGSYLTSWQMIRLHPLVNHLVFSERNMAQLAVIGWWGGSFRSRSLGVVVPPFMCVCSKISKQRTKTQSQNWQCRWLRILKQNWHWYTPKTRNRKFKFKRTVIYQSSVVWFQLLQFLEKRIFIHYMYDIFWRWGSCRSPPTHVDIPLFLLGARISQNPRRTLTPTWSLGWQVTEAASRIRKTCWSHTPTSKGTDLPWYTPVK